MGWFFGCFGGSSKKDRKHRAPVSPLPKQQKPSSVPLRVPVASSSAIPIKAFPVRDGSNSEDLFTVRQVSSSAPVRHTQGPYLHGVPGIRLPKKEEKPGPWHQLDDLEEELNDLRKQIERDSHDAETIREEVHCLKSCGSLVKSPTQLKVYQQVNHQQSSVQEGSWLSWLAPPGPSLARTLPEKNFQFEGLKVALCEPTSVKEGHGSLLAVQTPIQSENLRQSTMQHKTQANVQEDGFEAIQKSDAGNNLISPAKFQQEDQPVQGSSHCNAGITNSKANPDAPIERLCDNPYQTRWSLSGTEGTLPTNAIEDDSASMKKRRLAVNANSAQSSHVSKQQAEDNVSSGQQYHSLLGQKRLKVASSREQVGGEVKNSLLQAADPVPIHFFRCDSLSPIVESGTLNEESDSFDTEGDAQGPFDQQQSSYNSASQKTSQSPSLKQSPASQTKSVTFATINDEGYTTDELSYSRGAKYTEESYTNSTCLNDTNEEDDLETASYSPSTDSEETLSDLSPERCYSPPISPSYERSPVYRAVNSSGTTTEQQTVRFTSTQHSSANGGRKKQYVSRYGSEEDTRSDGESELFIDAVSHVSTEYSEREYKKWHSRTESMDSVSAQLARAADAIDTPPKQTNWVSTPNINIQGKHSSRIRNKPASSVLTPVENVSQWKQLKEREHQNQTVDGRAGIDGSRKYTSKRVDNIGTENLKAQVGDENKILPWTSPRKDNGQFKLTSQSNGTIVNTSLSHWAAASGPEATHVNVNASLSHMGITSRADTITVDGSLSLRGKRSTEPEPVCVDGSLSHWGKRTEPEPVCVDTSLSHWLNSSSKNAETQMSIGTSSNSSSSGRGGVESQAPPLISHIAKQTERRQPLIYAASERPILGAVGRGSSGNGKTKSPWDGKGTPNATAKYMEDQRVKWHSTPFEQRLEKALDKQGILLQKKLFAATPAAS